MSLTGTLLPVVLVVLALGGPVAPGLKSLGRVENRNVQGPVSTSPPTRRPSSSRRPWLGRDAGL